MKQSQGGFTTWIQELFDQVPRISHHFGRANGSKLSGSCPCDQDFPFKTDHIACIRYG